MKERQERPEEEFVIRLPLNEIQRRIVINRKLLEDLNRQVVVFHAQPRNQEGHAWLAGVERQIAQHQGMLAAYEDAQTLKWGESPEEQQLIRERKQLVTLAKESGLLPQKDPWFLIGYRQGMWEISLRSEK